MEATYLSVISEQDDNALRIREWLFVFPKHRFAIGHYLFGATDFFNRKHDVCESSLGSLDLNNHVKVL